MTIQSFFEELQALDEATKRKIMIVATIVLMIGVIYVWLGYFNGIVASSQTQDQTAQNSGATQGTSGTATIGNDFIGIMQGIGNAFKNPGQYTISPSK